MSGRALAKARPPEGEEGIGRLHGLIAERVGRRHGAGVDWDRD